MRTIALGLFASVVLLSGCRNSAVEQSGQSPALPNDIQTAFVQGNTEFAFQFFQQLAEKTEPNQNLVCSPLGVQLLFSLMLNASEGQIYDEIAETLGYGKGAALDAVNRHCEALQQTLLANDAKQRLHIANSIWYDNAAGVLHPDFAQATAQFYKAEAHQVSFADAVGTAEKINKWVRQHTFGTVKEIIRPEDLLAGRPTTFAGVNCLYFKGLFERAFERSKVAAPFYTETGRKVSFYPMVQRFEAVPYMKGAEVEMVALPYQGGAVRLYLLLPAAGRSVQSLVADLAAGRWNEWLAQLRPTALRVELPRFTIDNQGIDNQHDLEGVLQALGIRAAFAPPGFTKIYENGADPIGIVRQGAKIVVNEEGTEAGAATIVITMRSAFEEPVFRANRPFVFLLRHEPTGAILFAGILRQPQE
jgi:serine protease inhibitor